LRKKRAIPLSSTTRPGMPWTRSFAGQTTLPSGSRRAGEGFGVKGKAETSTTSAQAPASSPEALPCPLPRGSGPTRPLPEEGEAPRGSAPTLAFPEDLGAKSAPEAEGFRERGASPPRGPSLSSLPGSGPTRPLPEEPRGSAPTPASPRDLGLSLPLRPKGFGKGRHGLQRAQASPPSPFPQRDQRGQGVPTPRSLRTEPLGREPSPRPQAWASPAPPLSFPCPKAEPHGPFPRERPCLPPTSPAWGPPVAPFLPPWPSPLPPGAGGSPERIGPKGRGWG